MEKVGLEPERITDVSTNAQTSNHLHVIRTAHHKHTIVCKFCKQADEAISINSIE